MASHTAQAAQSSPKAAQTPHTGQEPPTATTLLDEPSTATAVPVTAWWWKALRRVGYGGAVLILFALVLYRLGNGVEESAPPSQVATAQAPAPSAVQTAQVPSCPDAADDERVCDIDNRGAFLTLGVGTKTWCVYPLSGDGRNYVVTYEDGSTTQNATARSVSVRLSLPAGAAEGTVKRVRYFLRNTAAECPS